MTVASPSPVNVYHRFGYFPDRRIMERIHERIIDLVPEKRKKEVEELLNKYQIAARSSDGERNKISSDSDNSRCSSKIKKADEDDGDERRKSGTQRKKEIADGVKKNGKHKSDGERDGKRHVERDDCEDEKDRKRCKKKHFADKACDSMEKDVDMVAGKEKEESFSASSGDFHTSNTRAVKNEEENRRKKRNSTKSEEEEEDEEDEHDGPNEVARKKSSVHATGESKQEDKRKSNSTKKCQCGGRGRTVKPEEETEESDVRKGHSSGSAKRDDSNSSSTRRNRSEEDGRRDSATLRNSKNKGSSSKEKDVSEGKTGKGTTTKIKVRCICGRRTCDRIKEGKTRSEKNRKDGSASSSIGERDKCASSSDSSRKDGTWDMSQCSCQDLAQESPATHSDANLSARSSIHVARDGKSDSATRDRSRERTHSEECRERNANLGSAERRGGTSCSSTGKGGRANSGEDEGRDSNEEVRSRERTPSEVCRERNANLGSAERRAGGGSCSLTGRGGRCDPNASSCAGSGFSHEREGRLDSGRRERSTERPPSQTCRERYANMDSAERRAGGGSCSLTSRGGRCDPNASSCAGSGLPQEGEGRLDSGRRERSTERPPSQTCRERYANMGSAERRAGGGSCSLTSRGGRCDPNASSCAGSGLPQEGDGRLDSGRRERSTERPPSQTCRERYANMGSAERRAGGVSCSSTGRGKPDSNTNEGAEWDRALGSERPHSGTRYKDHDHGHSELCRQQGCSSTSRGGKYYAHSEEGRMGSGANDQSAMRVMYRSSKEDEGTVLGETDNCYGSKRNAQSGCSRQSQQASHPNDEHGPWEPRPGDKGAWYKSGEDRGSAGAAERASSPSAPASNQAGKQSGRSEILRLKEELLCVQKELEQFKKTVRSKCEKEPCPLARLQCCLKVDLERLRDAILRLRMCPIMRRKMCEANCFRVGPQICGYQDLDDLRNDVRNMKRELESLKKGTG